MVSSATFLKQNFNIIEVIKDEGMKVSLSDADIMVQLIMRLNFMYQFFLKHIENITTCKLLSLFGGV